MHGVEELVQPPYLFGPMLDSRLILADGREMRYACRRHGFGRYRQRYDRVVLLLEPGRTYSRGPVLEAETHVLDASAMWCQGVAALRADPYFFVEQE